MEQSQQQGDNIQRQKLRENKTTQGINTRRKATHRLMNQSIIFTHDRDHSAASGARLANKLSNCETASAELVSAWQNNRIRLILHADNAGFSHSNRFRDFISELPEHGNLLWLKLKKTTMERNEKKEATEEKKPSRDKPVDI